MGEEQKFFLWLLSQSGRPDAVGTLSRNIIADVQSQCLRTGELSRIAYVIAHAADYHAVDISGRLAFAYRVYREIPKPKTRFRFWRRRKNE